MKIKRRAFLGRFLWVFLWVLSSVFVALLPVESARALVTVSGPIDARAFLPLFRPTGEFDETGLSGFEFLISSTTDPFTGNDQYLIQGEDTNPIQAIGNDLGDVEDLRDVTFTFSIQHNLVGGRNFTFALTNSLTSETSVLCWGQNCAMDANAAEFINGEPPIMGYNGLQFQVRSQEIRGSSATVEILSLNGVDVGGSPFFDETVNRISPGTIPLDTGRRGQWMMADNLDLLVNEWELLGTVRLDRPDAALVDRTKVRLSVDLVRDPNLPFLVPEPASLLLSLASLATVGFLGRFRHLGSEESK